MNNVLTDESIYQELTRIFNYKSKNEENKEIINRGFVCTKIKKGKVLFVGINPSYPSGSKVDSFLYDIDKAVTEYPKHYSKFPNLIKNTKFSESWSYLDLFQFRETNQKKVIGFVRNDPQFLVSQLKLTHKMICEIKPEIIVVCNSEASNFFGINKKKSSEGWQNIWLGYDFEFDKNFGLDFIKSKNEHSILKNENESLIGKPILFTSTLTYMAKFDKRRLNWQIKRFMYNRNSKNQL